MRAPQIGFGFFGRGAIGWFRRVRNYIRGNKGCAQIELAAPAAQLGMFAPFANLGIFAQWQNLTVSGIVLAELGIAQNSVSLYAEECE